MESCLYHIHHIRRIIQTNHHVFQIIKLPHHLPDVYEWFIQRHDSWRMADCLHGWHAHHSCKWKRKHQMNKKSSSENERTRPPPEAKEMQVWSKRSRLPGPHTLTRRNCHWSHQTIWDCRVASPHQSKGCPILLRIHLLLQEIHRRLFKHHPPTHWSHQEKPGVKMVTFLSKSIWPTKGRIFQTTHTLPPWPQQTFHHHHWCLQGRIWRNSPSSRFKWRMASLLIPFTILLPRWKKLQHLWLRTSCGHKGTKNMETLPSRIPLPSKSLYQS